MSGVLSFIVGDRFVINAASSCGCARAHPLGVAPEPLSELGIRLEGESALINYDAFRRLDEMGHPDRLPRDGTRHCVSILQWVSVSAPSGCSPEPLSESENRLEAEDH